MSFVTTNTPFSSKCDSQAANAQILNCEVVILGGGPSGATAARELAKAGIDVLMIEKAVFPRFQIGESFLPANLELLQDLGLAERLKAHPHMVKRGAEFGMGDNLSTTLFHFDLSLVGRGTGSFNIVRSEFDVMLRDAAVEAGTRLLQPATARQITHLEDGRVELELADGRAVHAKYLIDGTGQASMVGRHLKLKVKAPEKHLQKVSYFGHFTDVKRLAGYNEGMITIVVCDEGWFWIIPLDATTTSVGLVINEDAAKKIFNTGVRPDELLQWAIKRSPLIASRMENAKGTQTNEMRADYSYRCAPFTGEGYFLVGDAALFLDPVFSAGVCLCMHQGVQVAGHLVNILRHNASPAVARQQHVKFLASSTYWFKRLIELYYTHGFRELFLHGRGPLDMHRAIISILAGHVFPAPAWKLKWRLWLFELSLKIHNRFALVPRRKHFSLLGELNSTSALSKA